MIGLDSNVVLRYVLQDDPEQAARATRVFDELTEAAPAYVSMVVLVECVWVLRRAYGYGPDAVVEVVRQLLAAREVVMETPDLVRRALRRVGASVEFSDAVIVEQSLAAGCDTVVTFDRRAARDAGMTLLV